MMQYKTYGTLYQDGLPITEGGYYAPNAVISIGKMNPQKPLRWVTFNGLWIALKVILRGVSCDDLNKQGYVTGKRIIFDGVEVIARIPRLGSKPGKHSEWKKFVEIAEREYRTLEETDLRFWGQEQAVSRPGFYATISGTPPYSWTAQQGDCRDSLCGWRPVLEPVNIEIGPELLGHRITVWSGDISLTGKLKQYSDYDLVFENVLAWPFPSPETKQFFCRTKEKLFIVNRERITLTHLAYKHE